MSNKERLIKILTEINPDIDYEQETALVDDGLFDSLEVMSIVMEIGDQFGIEIDPDDIVPENFNSITKILELIEKNQ